MDISKFMSKVYLWMSIGLAITFVTGVTIAGNANVIETIFSTSLYWFIIIAEIITVIVLSARVNKMSYTGACIAFIIYSLLSGLTFSIIFIAYHITSIMYVFIITAGIMILFSIIGYFTKLNLTKLGSFLLMALIGIVIASILNALLINSGEFNIVLCIISILVFIGLIAWDTQNIKRMYEINPDNKNLAIYGALQLYLDFINIFIDLLRLFGKDN